MAAVLIEKHVRRLGVPVKSTELAVDVGERVERVDRDPDARVDGRLRNAGSFDASASSKPCMKTVFCTTLPSKISWWARKTSSPKPLLRRSRIR